MASSCALLADRTRADRSSRAVTLDTARIERIRKTTAGLVVHFLGNARGVLYPWWWLADHGEDEHHRNPDSLQRTNDTFAIPGNIRPTAAALDASRKRVGVKWVDGPPTMHSASQLFRVAAQSRRLDRPPVTRLKRPPSQPGVSLWSTPAPEEAVRRFDYSKAIRGEDTTAEMLRSLWQWGFVVLDGVPPGRAPVKEIAGQFGYVRQTIFGGVWNLAADVTDHLDSAYDTTYLAPHTDGTYSHDGPGLQLFACQERLGTGGDSILVDGFAAAARLFDAHPHHVDVLSRAAVMGQYVEPGVSLVAERPPLRFDSQGHLVQVTFNNDDRAPFMIRPTEDAEALRDAYAALHSVLDDPSCRTHISWEPGQTLVFDNWRVLHGRTGFDGRRRFFGCYTNHEDLSSRLRQLELIR